MNPGDLITAEMRHVFPAIDGKPAEVVMTPIGGLTKIEWFAGMALQGLMVGHDPVRMGCVETALTALKAASAMILALGKEGA